MFDTDPFGDIEVTSEMTAAGLEALAAVDAHDGQPAEMVDLIYQAMETARRAAAPCGA